MHEICQFANLFFASLGLRFRELFWQGWGSYFEKVSWIRFPVTEGEELKLQDFACFFIMVPKVMLLLFTGASNSH